ncbi:family 10 glycosylhydrolase [Aetokthonos hydrillicola Thurmond2011]|jgi:uncharacterized lipoprotein YddW (UPF0748 family)|uniref:Family 10 glycosylhydrolase n=1 Tax=Aetokthonos hydrillicola Thurmond2011 TaxID=2712845 RepID=A0AAP5MDJ6_9CYAN|nr:family 10 glycosylhydrolase [Aetokthonos hydrillicola]MBW4587062.1 family 10 glycosylhydrolase [Aetokthonos hydrillicola CCALA 1050]MDR9899688.1 family 10 glycosylhydrolase [Aetokthonos hydrillicola Thurmond2011]
MIKIKKTGLFILKWQFLIYYFFHILPVIGATSEPVLTVVQSQENANQWVGIVNRLQAAKVKYCVVPLDSVRNAADWGNRGVLFLPNVEILSPAQAIALEEWMSRGGRLIASGPVASQSDPGVRQLLRAIIGGYWGFSLNTSQKLQPSKANLLDWDTNQTGLFGKVHGGVVIADDMTTRSAAVWDSKDNPPAVVTNDRSTFFGWRWGVDAVSSAQLDTAWLQTTLNHIKTSSVAIRQVPGASQSCSTSVAIRELLVGSRGQGVGGVIRGGQENKVAPPPVKTPVKTVAAPQVIPISKILPAPIQQKDEAIDQLEEAVRLDVVPNSSSPINRTEAIALQQELENLIGRVESANLAASVYDGNLSYAKAKQVQFASVRPETPVYSVEDVLTQAREVAKNLPQLIAQKQYSQARHQWLIARANLWNLFPVDRRLAQPEIRAIWLDRGTIVRAGSEQGLSRIFDRLAKAGINTIFFETVNSSYTIYPSKVAPQQNPLIRGWDPLLCAVKLAHERGMELHAWVWTFAAGNQRHNQIIHLNPNYPGPVLAVRPDWAGYDNRGRMIPVGQHKPFFDPANPQVRQYLLSLYEEIVTRYDVDGLQLDYIRYPFQDPTSGRTYGYGKEARRQFAQLTGVDPTKISPSQRDLWQKWTEFRTSLVDSFVNQVSTRLRQKRPNLILSAAVFPLPEQERIQKIQQNWEVWAKRGDIDLIIPMTYAHDTPTFERLGRSWIASKQLGSSLLVPGIRLLSLPVTGAFDQIQLIRDLPVNGYALFAAENFSTDLYKVFRSTQGNTEITQKQLTPYRQPFQTAAARYTALQQEWKLAKQNNQMQVPSTILADYNAQAQIVQTALDQLATKPNASQLIVAKASLSRFKSQFRVWMRSVALSNPYQVRAWENRLTTIERLLNYGERQFR